MGRHSFPQTGVTIFCSNCGNKLSEIQKFCPSCGSENNAAINKSTSSTLPLTESSTAVRDEQSCPECNQKDSVQKVASIWSTDQSEVEGKTTLLLSAKYQGTTVSGLAKRLSAPVKPWAAKENKWNTWIGCSGCAVVLGLGSVIISFAVDPSTTLGLIVFSVIGVIILITNLYNLKKQSAEEREIQKQAWDRSTNRLGQAWYCSRDDLVFDANLSGSPEVFVHKCFSNI